MKRNNLIIMVFFLILSSVLVSQETEDPLLTVAVMDSQLGSGIPYNVSPLTANYVSDTLYSLKTYRIIPRNEIYFGWVGAPSPAVDIPFLLGRGDYGQLGRELNADLICLLRVENRGSGFRLSGELIQAETGVILSSQFTEASGILDLINASKLMGEKLSGNRLSEGERKTPLQVNPAPLAPQVKDPQTPANRVTPPSPEGDKNKTGTGQKPADSGKTDPAGAFGSLTFGIIFPEFNGSAKSQLKEDNLLHPLVGSVTAMSGGAPVYNLGLNMNIRVAGDSLFCLDLGMNITWEWIEYQSAYLYTKMDGENFIFMDFYLGPGVILPLGRYFQAAAGVTLGYGMVEPNYALWDSGTEIAGGLTLGYSIGIEARTPGDFVISLKYMGILAAELDKAGLVDDDVFYSGDTDFGFSGFQIGMGTSF